MCLGRDKAQHRSLLSAPSRCFNTQPGHSIAKGSLPRCKTCHKPSLCRAPVLLLAPQEQADRSQRAAKYAAVLALAGVDPVVAHQNASFRFLVDYVRRRRYDSHLPLQLHGLYNGFDGSGCHGGIDEGTMGSTATTHVDRGRSAASHAKRSTSAPASSAATLHEQPHFMLPYLLHLLAHHPDFPDQQVCWQSPEVDYCWVRPQRTLSSSQALSYTADWCRLPKTQETREHTSPLLRCSSSHLSHFCYHAAALVMRSKACRLSRKCSAP